MVTSADNSLLSWPRGGLPGISGVTLMISPCLPSPGLYPWGF